MCVGGWGVEGGLETWMQFFVTRHLRWWWRFVVVVAAVGVGVVAAAAAAAIVAQAPTRSASRIQQ
eukprot:1157218-Pelagomonas_calceolata.AAC.10